VSPGLVSPGPVGGRRKTPSAKPSGANVMNWTVGADAGKRKYLFAMPGISWLIPG
jgi:hypothetical protein